MRKGSKKRAPSMRQYPYFPTAIQEERGDVIVRSPYNIHGNNIANRKITGTVEPARGSH